MLSQMKMSTETQKVDVLAVMRCLLAAAEKSMLDAAGVQEGEGVPPEVVEALAPLVKAHDAARAAMAELIELSRHSLRLDVTSSELADNRYRLRAAIARIGGEV